MKNKSDFKALAGLIAFFIVMGGIGYWDTQKKEAERQAKAKYLASHPEVAAAEQKKQQQQAEQQRKQRQAAKEAPRKLAGQITSELRKDWGYAGHEPTWYGAIKAISVDGDKVTVQTNLVKNEIFNDTIRGVCAGVSPYVFSKPGLETVVVRGGDGSVLVRRNGLSDSCSP